MSPFQPLLFEQSTRVKIVLSEDHELVRLTHLINWTALITIASTIREHKVKKAVGPQLHYRALLDEAHGPADGEDGEQLRSLR